MHPNGAAPKQLTRNESLRLLATEDTGRIIFTRRAMPAVELVHFTLDNGDIVIKTDLSGSLAATRGAVVAFEADRLDATDQAGWSVTVVGCSREVTDPVEIGRLQRIGLRSWTAGEPAHFLRISPELLNGQRLYAHGEVNDFGTRHPAESEPVDA